MIKNDFSFDEVVKFSHFYVVSFLRIESLDSFLNRKREYEKYTVIPQLLFDYLKLTTDEEKINFISTEFNKLTVGLYENSWNKIIDIPIKNKKIDIQVYDKSTNNIDKLNSLLNNEYDIEDKEFFSSINIINTKEKSNKDYSNENIISELDIFFDEFAKIKEELSKENPKRYVDLKICMLIISTEFSNFLHHIYVAYYKEDNETSNIIKSLNHLKRANNDAKKARDLIPEIYSYATVQDRLKEINKVGM